MRWRRNSVSALALFGGLLVQDRCAGNQFDGEATTYSPEGRIYQVEYAHEATRRGCSIVGIADSKWAVLAAWRPALSNTRACPPRLVWDVDPHVGIAAAGLRSDVQYIADVARTDCANHQYAWGSPITCRQLARHLGDVVHDCTRRAGKRPLATDILVAGADVDGKASIIRLTPAGSLQAWKACAVGANASAASDALAKSQEEADSKAKMVKSGTKGERAADDGGEEVVTSLISRAIQALSRASQESGVSKMNAADLCVQIYGADGCRMYTDEQLQVFLDSMTPHQGSAAD